MVIVAIQHTDVNFLYGFKNLGLKPFKFGPLALCGYVHGTVARFLSEKEDDDGHASLNSIPLGPTVFSSISAHKWPTEPLGQHSTMQ